MSAVERISREHAQFLQMKGLGPHPDAKLRVLSLGAGVQSSTMLLMACRGEIEPGLPDVAIFADTGWEPRGVYEWLDWLEGEAHRLTEGRMQIIRVSNGDLRENLTSDEPRRYATAPFFLRNVDGSQGMGRRQCTEEHKLKPIRWAIRRWLGVGRRDRIAPNSAEVWIGISVDEAVRASQAREAWRHNRWPLIEAGMSRQDCLDWFKERYPNLTPPKSACIGCPFHNDAMWRDMRDNDPESWADAVEVDAKVRVARIQREGLEPLVAEQFMHRSMVPLDQVDLSTPEDHGQLNLFINECEGMCGV